jgi:hypothetical protein
VRDPAEERFLALVTADPTVRAVLERAPTLGVGDCRRTPCPHRSQARGGTLQGAGPGRRPLYFDEHTSWEAEDAVIRAGAELFGDLPVPVEVRNEARVHLWYAEHFGTPAPPFRDCADAIDHFAAVCCCYGVTAAPDGEPRVSAPHGYDDLFRLIVRPNRRLAPRHVYETKTARWQAEWPELTVLPWDDEPQS